MHLLLPHVLTRSPLRPPRRDGTRALWARAHRALRRRLPRRASTCRWWAWRCRPSRTTSDLTTSQLQWVVSGYVLGYGGLLLLGGRAADLLGRRRVLLVGARGLRGRVRCSAASPATATLLIAARFVKGVSAAFTAPAALSIITTTFPEGPARNRALSIFTDCRRERLLARPGARRAADRARLALDVPAAGPVAAVLAGRSRRAATSRATRHLARPARLRHPRRGDGQRGDAAARPHGRRRAPTSGWASASTRRRLRRHAVVLFGAVRRRSSGASRIRWCGSGSCAPARLVRANIAAMALFGCLHRLPVHRHALPAVAARLVVAAHRARVPARRA